MGTYSKSTFGKIRGKVGESVGSKWRGVKVIRSLPEKSSKPATLLQLAVHARFALSAALLSPIKEVLNLGFGDKKLNKITGYNAAVKSFLAEAILGDYPSYSIDYSKVKMSKGSWGTADISITLSTNISFFWEADLNGFNSFADDTMVFIIFNQDKNTYKLNNSHMREDLEFSLPYPGKAGDVIHIWSFCVKRDGQTVSNSVYVGTFTIPVAI